MWNNFLHLEVEKCISTILANNPIESDEGKEQHPLLVHVSIHFLVYNNCRCVTIYHKEVRELAKPNCEILSIKLKRKQ